jgi:hypothetical protein
LVLRLLFRKSPKREKRKPIGRNQSSQDILSFFRAIRKNLSDH